MTHPAHTGCGRAAGAYGRTVVEPARQLRITTTVDGGASTVAAAGEVDLATADALRDAVAAALAAAPRVVLDLTGVSYFDSAGVKVVSGFVGRPLEIVVDGRHGLVRRILSISGLDDCFPIVER